MQIPGTLEFWWWFFVFALVYAIVDMHRRK